MTTARVRGTDVLAMTSGIDCLEIGAPGAYDDPAHPFYRFEASLGWRSAPQEPAPTPYQVVAALPSHRPPGEVYEYTSVNTFVLSWLIERAAGLPFAEVLTRLIWQRAGFEAPAQLCGSAAGAPASHGGLSTTLRDLARFGMLFTPSARLVSEHPVISPEHLRRIHAAGRPELHRDQGGPLPAHITDAYGPTLPPASRQWDYATADGDLFKGGFGGQGLYVSPAHDSRTKAVALSMSGGAWCSASLRVADRLRHPVPWFRSLGQLRPTKGDGAS